MKRIPQNGFLFENLPAATSNKWYNIWSYEQWEQEILSSGLVGLGFLGYNIQYLFPFLYDYDNFYLPCHVLHIKEALNISHPSTTAMKEARNKNCLSRIFYLPCICWTLLPVPLRVFPKKKIKHLSEYESFLCLPLPQGQDRGREKERGRQQTTPLGFHWATGREKEKTFQPSCVLD